MEVHAGLKVQLFADEKQFPELVNPVQMAWDQKGRLWVANWRTYPERRPTDKVGDSLLVFEDVNHDGKADKVTHFASDLNCPTGFQFYKDGVLLMQAPDLWFIRDTDGDGKADWKERVLMGIDSADSHHTTNAMALDPGAQPTSPTASSTAARSRPPPASSATPTARSTASNLAPASSTATSPTALPTRTARSSTTGATT